MELSVHDLFTNGRTCRSFAKKEISRKLLEEIYNLTKLGATSANCCPLRIVFVQGEKAKQKLLECAMAGNVEAIKNAPVTALFAYDSRFYEKLPILFPQNPGMKNYFTSSESVTVENAFRNSTLQAAYFMVVARSKGLATGPMSGFDATKLESAFFSGTHWKANFICNLGYAEGKPQFERLPRLPFDEVCLIV